MAISGSTGNSGEEIKGAVLFTDIWGFTTFSEKNLPYDVIHALNLLFRNLGQAVDDNDGYVDIITASPNRIDVLLQTQSRIFRPVLNAVRRGCLGTVSGMFDGSKPHRDRGRVSRARSVAELLRVYFDEL